MGSRSEWAETYDRDHGREVRSLQPGGIADLLVKLQGLSGVKWGAAITARLERVSVLRLHWGVEATRRRGVAETLHAAAAKKQRAADSLVILNAAKGKDPTLPLDLGVDEVAEAAALLKETQRLEAAVAHANLVATKDLMAEIATPAFLAKLGALWADRVALQPMPSWTLADLAAAEALAEQLASVIAALVLAISTDGGDVTDSQSRDLRRALAAKPRPQTMPTLDSVRKSHQAQTAATPYAKSVRTVEARKQDEKAEAERLANFYKTDRQRDAAAAQAKKEEDES